MQQCKCCFCTPYSAFIHSFHRAGAAQPRTRLSACNLAGHGECKCDIQHHCTRFYCSALVTHLLCSVRLYPINSKPLFTRHKTLYSRAYEYWSDQEHVRAPTLMRSVCVCAAVLANTVSQPSHLSVYGFNGAESACSA